MSALASARPAPDAVQIMMGLEDAVCNAVLMAKLTDQIVGDMTDRDNVEMVLFAIVQVTKMTQELADQYFAALEAMRGAA